MGCGSSSSVKTKGPRQAYPGQGGSKAGYQNYNNYGRAPTGRVTAPVSGGDGQDAIIVGAGIGYGMGMGYQGGMIDGGIPMMGQELPMGYHMGPVMPEHNVEVMGVDVY